MFTNTPFISVSCDEIIGSYDPNDKLVTPAGIGDEHFIEANTDLEYKIRFQNTGNDTAFQVIVVDTLDVAHLDISTFQALNSSHPYSLEIVEGEILRFTFLDILLLDSTANEPESHGFVRYEIEQNADLEKGIVITNDAGIYFDFNAPVITNKVFNMIGDTTLTVFVSKPKPQHDIDVYPNPTSNFVHFELEKLTTKGENMTVNITDINGRVLKTKVLDGTSNSKIYVGDLPYGVYLYSLFLDNERVNGKLIVTP